MFNVPFKIPNGATAPKPVAPKPAVASSFAYPGISRAFTPEEQAANAIAIAPVAQAPSQNLVSYQQAAAPAGPPEPTAAQLDPLFASLGSLDTILANKNQGVMDEFGRTIAQYDSADALDKQNYGQNVQRNESSYTGNNQAALLNAANASTGLRGVMSSLGALGGSGLNIVKKLVGLAANSDTGAARQTFDTNATSLNQAWGQAEQQQRQRRDDAVATRDNNMQNNKAQILNSRQGILQQLAQLYGSENPKGTQYASEAASLAAPIAETTRATVAPYAKASTLFSPAALQDYLAGTQNLDVSTTGGATPINSPVFTSTQKKDQLSGVA